MIIGFGGVKQSGKDTSSQPLLQKGFVHYSFARPLKELCAKVFSLTFEQLDDQRYKEIPFKKPIYFDLSNIHGLLNGLEKLTFISNKEQNDFAHALFMKKANTPRELLQIIGTEGVRDCIGKDFWCQILIRNTKDKDIVVTDMRFPNERETIKKLGGKLVLLKRSGYLPSNHSSDNLLGEDTEYDLILHNDGSIEDLHKKVMEYYEQITK